MPKPKRHQGQTKVTPQLRAGDPEIYALLRNAQIRFEEYKKRWRLHRKLTAHSTPLEFSLRPHLALLLYTLGISLLGRGLSHFNGEPAYWSLWWNEELSGIFAWIMSDGWHDYATNQNLELLFMTVQHVLMWLFIFLGIVALYAPRRLSQALRSHGRASSLDLKAGQVSRNTKKEGSAQEQRLADPPSSAKHFSRLFLLAGVLQLIYVICLWIDHNYYWATLSEHLMQIMIPLTCVLMLPYTPQEWETPAELMLTLSLSLCFIGHGVFALGYFPVPADFVVMTMNILRLSEANAFTFLTLVGSLDLLAALLIWLPIRELRRGAIIYMVVWGALTALARPLGLPSSSAFEHLILWGPEGLWRLSHALVPLWIWRRRYV